TQKRLAEARVECAALRLMLDGYGSSRLMCVHMSLRDVMLRHTGTEVIVSDWEGQNPRLYRASGFRLLSLQSEPRSAVRCASDVSTDATPGDCVPTPPRPIPYGRGPVHGPKTAASRDVLSSPRTPTRSSASSAGRPLWRLRSPSRLDAQG